MVTTEPGRPSRRSSSVAVFCRFRASETMLGKESFVVDPIPGTVTEMSVAVSRVAHRHRHADFLSRIGRNSKLGQIGLRRPAQRIVDGVEFAHPVLGCGQLTVEVLKSILVARLLWSMASLQVVDVRLEFGALLAYPFLVGITFALGRGQSVGTDRWTGISRNGGVTLGHIDRGCQLLVDRVGLGQDRVQPGLPAAFRR